MFSAVVGGQNIVEFTTFTSATQILFYIYFCGRSHVLLLQAQIAWFYNNILNFSLQHEFWILPD